MRGYLTIKSCTCSLSGYAENKVRRINRMMICLADIIKKLPLGVILLKGNTTLHISCGDISISQIQQWQLQMNYDLLRLYFVLRINYDHMMLKDVSENGWCLTHRYREFVGLLLKSPHHNKQPFQPTHLTGRLRSTR